MRPSSLDGISLYGLFRNCENLEDISLLSNWDVSFVIDFSYMFTSCKKLNDISALNSWKLNKIPKQYKKNMFKNTMI